MIEPGTILFFPGADWKAIRKLGVSPAFYWECNARQCDLCNGERTLGLRRVADDVYFCYRCAEGMR